MKVYINDVSMFLPHQPVTNEEIETVLGKIDGISSRAKRIVLKNNGIRERYYAISRETGELTHTNAQLTAEAVRRLNPYDGFIPGDIECLCCGTTSPDVLFPGHALMVQGELGLHPCEAVTAAGICASGMIAMKYAVMNIATGMSQNAVATGSELSSSYMRSDFFSKRTGEADDPETTPLLSFDTDFLRWMLSDGAGSAFLSADPRGVGPNLRVEWIDYLAYAGELETCMYGGGVKNTDGSITGWRQKNRKWAAAQPHLMAVKQDIRQLDHNIVDTMKRTLSACVKKHGLKASEVDWFLPHYSSAYFKDKFYRGMREIGFEIPETRWFTNLATAGNTGAAAIYIILAALLHSGKLSKGERLLCFIPESGRFSHCFLFLTVV
jgi:3-oxoacyl-[acyl-carrier-protein] synthase III